MHPVHLRNIDLNLLLPLNALLEERNVTKAGQRVNLSQSAMSRALERLREALGDELLIRSHGEYQLTSRGAELREELGLLLPRLERLWSGQSFSPEQASGRIRIVMTDFASALILPLLMKKLTSLAPLLQVEITQWGERSFEELISGKVDLVFSPLAAPPPLQMELLMDERFACLISETHPFRGQGFTLKQYLSYGHVAIETQANQQTLVDRPLAESGLRRQIVLRLPFFIPGILALGGTELVLTSPWRLAKAMLPHYKLRMLKAPAEIPDFRYFMMWHPRLHGEPLHSWFREIVRLVIRESPLDV